MQGRGRGGGQERGWEGEKNRGGTRVGEVGEGRWGAQWEWKGGGQGKGGKEEGSGV
jgi:hypothetical protein